MSRAALLALALASCSTGRDSAAQQSAGQVARAVEVLRNAANDGKSRSLASLSQLPCAAPDVCSVRDACVAAYTLHVDGLALTEQAKARLRAGEDRQAGLLVLQADLKLKEASAPVEDCVQREATLRRQYKLR